MHAHMGCISFCAHQLQCAHKSDSSLRCVQLGAAIVSLKRLTMFLMLQDRSTEVRRCKGCSAHALTYTGQESKAAIAQFHRACGCYTT